MGTSTSANTRAKIRPPISPSELRILQLEAEAGARRLTRRLRLPGHEREDIVHEFLLDLIHRMQSFVPTRGTLGAFAGKVVRHRSVHIAERINRERRVFASIAADLFTIDDLIAGINAPPPLRPTAMVVDEHYRATETRIDIKRALQGLTSNEIRLCSDLIDRTPTEISRNGVHSRAGVYRSANEFECT